MSRSINARQADLPSVDNSWKTLKYWKVKMEDIKDCQECVKKGRAPFPISPAVGYCRRCKLDK